MMAKFLRIKSQLANREEGQGLVEYALILVLISIAAIATMGPLGTTVAGVYTTVGATTSGPNWACALVVDDSADQAAHVEVCAYNGGPGGNLITSITYGRFAGTVTYFARQYQAAWYETPDGVVPIYEYSYNYREGYSVGTPAGLGSTYRFEVTLIDGGTMYSKPVTLAVGPWQVFSDITYPWRCREDTDPWYGYKKICDEYIDYSSGRGGLFVW